MQRHVQHHYQEGDGIVLIDWRKEGDVDHHESSGFARHPESKL